MATTSKDFKIKNGLIVEGLNATINGFDVITEASSVSDLSDVDASGATDAQALVYNVATSSWIPASASMAFSIHQTKDTIKQQTLYHSLRRESQ